MLALQTNAVFVIDDFCFYSFITRLYRVLLNMVLNFPAWPGRGCRCWFFFSFFSMACIFCPVFVLCCCFSFSCVYSVYEVFVDFRFFTRVFACMCFHYTTTCAEMAHTFRLAWAVAVAVFFMVMASQGISAHRFFPPVVIVLGFPLFFCVFSGMFPPFFSLHFWKVVFVPCIYLRCRFVV